MAENTNDNDAAVEAESREPDAHGQAAMLLVESLIHGLVSRSVISVEEAVEIVQTAADVDVEIAIDRGKSPVTLRHSLTILETISSSLGADLQPAQT